MAVSQVPLLLLSVISLFLVPALSNPFGYCYDRPYSLHVRNVTVFPKQVRRTSTNVNLTITGRLDKPIPNGGTVQLIVMFGSSRISENTYSLCDKVKCPVASGPFVIRFFNILNRMALNFPTAIVTVTIDAKNQYVPVVCIRTAIRIANKAAHPVSRAIE